MSWIRRSLLLVLIALLASNGGVARATPASYPLPVDGASAAADTAGMPFWQLAVAAAAAALVVATVAFLAGTRAGRHHASRRRAPVTSLG